MRLLSLAGATLCWTLVTLPFNGVNGSLINFLVAVAVGILWESHLATYQPIKVEFQQDGNMSKEGMMSQLFFFGLFILL